MTGDIDVNSVFAASLPSSHPSFAPQRHLEYSTRWRAQPLPDSGVELFIGVLSAGNHFSERMAVRKSWMQHRLVKSGVVVARFFVALVIYLTSLLFLQLDLISSLISSWGFLRFD